MGLSTANGCPKGLRQLSASRDAGVLAAESCKSVIKRLKQPHREALDKTIFQLDNSVEEFTVRSKPRKSEGVFLGLLVDQHQVWLDVAIPVTCPVTGQVMVPMFDRERLIIDQRHKDRHQRSIKRCSVLPFSFAFVVAPESCGALNLPHAGRPSGL